MQDKKNLLELRKKIKNKKPKFIRQDAHKKKKISKRWRKPKGLHSKMKNRLKGYRRMPSQGYRSPKKVRHLHKSGLKQIIIKSINDIENIKDNKEVGVVLSSSIGKKKKIQILNKCKDLKIEVLNIKDVDKFIKKIEAEIKKRKESKAKKKKEKDTKKKDREKKAKEKEEKEKKEEKTDAKKESEEDLADKIEKEEEKKKKEKQEKDKILTKKK